MKENNERYKQKIEWKKKKDKKRVARCFGRRHGRLPTTIRRHNPLRPKGAGASHLLAWALHTSSIFFLNYRKTITPLTPLEISKKTEVRKPKMSLDLRPKKVNSEGYAVIILYKKVKIQKHPSNINCVIVFKGTWVITLYNKHVKIQFYLKVYIHFFFFTFKWLYL